MDPILLLNIQTPYPLSSSLIEKLEKLSAKILEEHEFEGFNLNVVLCNNEFIRQLNSQYRHKDIPTDVLSFPTLENIEGENFEPLDKCLGDIVISVEKLKSQAVEYGVSEEEEFARLLIHGILHLIGYDHETGPEEEKKMFDLQDDYLSQVFI